MASPLIRGGVQAECFREPGCQGSEFLPERTTCPAREECFELSLGLTELVLQILDQVLNFSSLDVADHSRILGEFRLLIQPVDQPLNCFWAHCREPWLETTPFAYRYAPVAARPLAAEPATSAPPPVSRRVPPPTTARGPLGPRERVREWANRPTPGGAAGARAGRGHPSPAHPRRGPAPCG